MSVQELIEKYTRDIEDNERQISYYQSYPESELAKCGAYKAFGPVYCDIYARFLKYHNDILSGIVNDLKECKS